MSNHKINNEFSQELRRLLTSDPAHADTFNPLFQTLINNDAFLKALADSLAESLAQVGQEVEGASQALGKHLADYATDKQKLDGIEDGAQKNPTAQQILNAIKTVDGVGSGLDADTVRGSVPYTPLNAPCVFGKYVGSGASSRLITLGFSPEAVLVIPSDGILFQNVSSTSYWGGLAFRNNPCTAGDNRIVTVGTSGFYVYVTEIGKYGGVFTNHENRTFYYVAWKG